MEGVGNENFSVEYILKELRRSDPILNSDISCRLGKQRRSDPILNSDLYHVAWANCGVVTPSCPQTVLSLS
jgi:hypothetical protein